MACKNMKILVIILHSIILAIVNLISILFGFGIYHFFRQYNQLMFQAPIAVVFSIIVFITWIVVIKSKKISRLFPEDWVQFLIIFILSIAWAPVIFVPLHFLTQGYLTSFGNIFWTWVFQIPTNIVVLLLSFFIIYPKGKKQQGMAKP